MKAVVFGAGFQGYACALDLTRSSQVEKVLLVDQSPEILDKTAHKIHSPKIETCQADITQHATAVSLMKEGQVTVSAVPYFLNEMLTRAAIEAQCHMVDMGGNTDLVFTQMGYSQEAQAAGVTIVPDMGLAPGYANLLAAELVDSFDTVDSLEIRVGGLPQDPQPPLDYKLFFSVEGLVNEYIGDCVTLEDGKIQKIKSLTELEQLEFPAPVGKCEAFHTLGGSSTLPWTYEGKIKHLNYKTIRYPGHCEKIRLLEDLGFFDNQPVTLRDGRTVEPRMTTGAVLTRRLLSDDPRDYVVIRVTVQGQKAGEAIEERFECLDAYDETLQMTAMMRTTAFPVSIVAQLLGTGTITQSGVFPPERVVPIGVVREEMTRRGIQTTHTRNAMRSLVH